MIIIRGEHGEGGGQIVRTAVGLSAVTNKPVRIINIRKGRCEPGLKAQHLTGVETCRMICDGKTECAKIGSTELEFFPRVIKGGEYHIDVGTAGAITLVLQTLMIPAMHTKEKIKLVITGGTDVRWSPGADYFKNIFCDFMKRIGADIKVNIVRRGFYPKGGGQIEIEIGECDLNPINIIERGNPGDRDIISIASEELKKGHVCERQINGAKKIMDFQNSDILYEKSLSFGSAVHCSAKFEHCILGSGCLGEKGKKAEQVGREVSEDLKQELVSGACVDRHMADQLLPFMALTAERGESKIRTSLITEHAKTNIAIIEKFLPVKFSINEVEGIIACKKK